MDNNNPSAPSILPEPVGQPQPMPSYPQEIPLRPQPATQPAANPAGVPYNGQPVPPSAPPIMPLGGPQASPSNQPDPQQFFRSSYPVQAQAPVALPQADPNPSSFGSSAASKPKNPKNPVRLLLIAGAAVIGLAVLAGIGIIIALAVRTNNYKKAGERKINDFIAALKQAPDNKDRANEVINTVLQAHGINPGSTNSADISMVSKLASDTGLVAQTIKNAAPSQYDEQAGKNKNGKYAVNKFYEITVNNKKYYYRITSERQDNGQFRIADTTLSEQKLTPQ